MLNHTERLSSSAQVSDGSDTAANWMTANSALLKFEALHLDRMAAKSTFADCLRDGVLRSRAQRVDVSRERMIGKAWTVVAQGGHDPEDRGPIPLPPLTWRQSKDWTQDQVDWRWPYNKFSIVTSTAPFRRELLTGVEFHREDVDRILRTRRLAAGGAPRRDQDWTLFWHSLIDIAKNDRLSRSGFQSQVELRAELLDRIGDAFQEETIRKPVAQVWQKFVAN